MTTEPKSDAAGADPPVPDGASQTDAEPAVPPVAETSPQTAPTTTGPAEPVCLADLDDDDYDAYMAARKAAELKAAEASKTPAPQASTNPPQPATVRRSGAQQTASRNNGTKSHGPRTQAGKEGSRRSAQTHGLGSTVLVTTDTASPHHREYLETLEALRAEWRPATPMMEAIVKRMAVRLVLISAAGDYELAAIAGVVENVPPDPAIVELDRRVQLVKKLLLQINSRQQPLADPQEVEWLSPLLRRDSQLRCPLDYSNMKYRGDFCGDVLLGNHKLADSDKHSWRQALQAVLSKLERQLKPELAKLSWRKVVRQTPAQAFEQNFLKLTLYQSYGAKSQRILEKDVALAHFLQANPQTHAHGGADQDGPASQSALPPIADAAQSGESPAQSEQS